MSTDLAVKNGVTEVISSAEDRQHIAITVYNDNFAMIKESRQLTLPAGLVELRLREVSAQIQPETASLRAVNGAAISLLEQNFDFDLLSPAKLLQKYIGREVTVIRSHPTTGEERQETATVLSCNGGTVLRFVDRIETGVPGRIAFASVPDNLRDRPTLSILVDTAGGEQVLELSYLTGQMSWQADYVANLSAAGDTLALSGWVTLHNRSGAEYRDARLQLVAGKVNRIQVDVAPQERTRGAFAGDLQAASAAGPKEEQLADYHLYSYERTTTLADNQTKQLALLSTESIPVRYEYYLKGSIANYRGRLGGDDRKFKPMARIAFDNMGGSLEKPLPAGIVRVYAKDSKGGAQFIGEDRIEHTAKGETVKLNLGEAFDITVERKQTDYTLLGERGAQTSHRVEIRNAKEAPVTVRLEEPLPGEWHVVRESLAHVQDSASVASWHVGVPANGSAVLEYTVRAKW